MKDKYRVREMRKSAGPPGSASAASRPTGSAPPRGHGKPMSVIHDMLSGVGTGRSVRTSTPRGFGGGIGSTAPRSTQGGPSFADMSSVEQRVFDMLDDARATGWLYNGKPALCRKCGLVFARGIRCIRDPGHVCELESVTSAEERRLLEVNRMLKSTFDEPRLVQSQSLATVPWAQLVGLSQAIVTDLEGRN